MNETPMTELEILELAYDCALAAYQENDTDETYEAKERARLERAVYILTHR